MGLYTSRTWQAIHPADRAEIIPVIEGVRPGATTRVPWSSLDAVLRYTGLTVQYSKLRRFAPTVSIMTPEALLRYREQEEHAQSKPDEWRAEGQLYGYPECCIEQYCVPSTETERNAPHALTYQFGREMTRSIAETGSYPAVFDHLPIPFTPCSIRCTPAQDFASAIASTVAQHDPEAFEALRYQNRKDHARLYDPSGKLHREYLRVGARREIMHGLLRPKQWPLFNKEME